MVGGRFATFICQLCDIFDVESMIPVKRYLIRVIMKQLKRILDWTSGSRKLKNWLFVTTFKPLVFVSVKNYQFSDYVSFVIFFQTSISSKSAETP